MISWLSIMSSREVIFSDLGPFWNPVKEVIFIVGLPGSGKSHFVRHYMRDFFQSGYHFLDDPSHDMSPQELRACADKHRHLIVADPMLCLQKNREQAERVFSEFKVSWIFFENNLEVCLNNISFRRDSRGITEHFVRSLSKDYAPPMNALPIHKCE